MKIFHFLMMLTSFQMGLPHQYVQLGYPLLIYRHSTINIFTIAAKKKGVIVVGTNNKVIGFCNPILNQANLHGKKDNPIACIGLKSKNDIYIMST